MTKDKILLLILLTSLLYACKGTKHTVQNQVVTEIANPTNKVVLSSEIKWEMLNPARGDKSPKAGTVWGDRKGKVATGFLAKFTDGFSSPPHIHNVTYRAMVIKGLIHNDDANAENMWMPAGSFWTQPAGEAHITAAKGKSIAYVEIDSGPYLVKPKEEAFDDGEQPINIDINNMIWLNSSLVKIIDENQSNVEVAFLWENDNMNGNLIKLLPGFEGEIISYGHEFHAVVITGEAKYKMPLTGEIKILDSGSYFTSRGKSKHQIQIQNETESLIYIRTNGKVRLM